MVLLQPLDLVCNDRNPLSAHQQRALSSERQWRKGRICFSLMGEVKMPLHPEAGRQVEDCLAIALDSHAGDGLKGSA